MKPYLIIIVCTVFATQAVGAELPRQFEGVWVTQEKQHLCAQIKKEEQDALFAGGGVLLLQGDKYYTNRAACTITKVKINPNNEESIAVDYTCEPLNADDNSYKGKAVFSLYEHGLIDTNVDDAPYVNVYPNRCP